MIESFHTYIYTNCRAEEGLQQRDGFQFQAISRGADQTAMPVIQRSLLYEPSPQWMRERRAVSEYPPSLAHVWDGAIATAAGLYLGRESGGGREGNQLTHAIATNDHRTYGLVRPAQLFGAPFWTTVPSPTTECPELAPGWRPGPFGVAEAQRFVREEPEGERILAELLSELRRPDPARRRILFVARRPDRVLQWIAAATLLMPQLQALAVSFKIFTQNPAYAEHRVLAVHPDWSSGGVGVDNELGYAVFDLERQRRSEIPVDPDSRRWVQMFLVEDPYDVMDAVEVAAESGLTGLEAMAFALASVAGRPPSPRNVRPLVRWLEDSEPELVARYGTNLVDQLRAVVDSGSVEDLILLDRAVGANVPERAAAVRLDLLRAELRHLRTGGGVRPDALPGLGDAWDADSADAATDLFVDAFGEAQPDRFEALLRLARRYSWEPPLELFEPSVQRFVEYWANNATLPYEPDEWAGREGVEARLRVLLNQRLSEEPMIADLYGDLWWHPLLSPGPVTLSTPLDEATVAAAMLHLPDRRRVTLVGDVMRGLLPDPDPIGATRRAVGVMWRRIAPGHSEIQRLCSLLPPGTTFGEQDFPQLTAKLVNHPEGPADDDFKAAFALISRDLWRPPPAARAVLNDEENIRAIRLALLKKQVEPEWLAGMLATLPVRTLAAHQQRLLDSMIESPMAVGVLAVLTAEPVLARPYVERLARRVTDKDWQPAHMAMAFVLSNHGVPNIEVHVRSGFLESLSESVEKFLARTSIFKLGKVDEQIELLGQHWPRLWKAAKRSGRPGNVVGRAFRRRKS